MLEKRCLIFKLALVLLVLALASPANAELKTSFTASGNNVGIVVKSSGYGGPLQSSNHQFPAGSGNFYSTGRWNWGVHVIRDCDGNGTVEDSACILSRGGSVTGGVNSLEAIDLITSLAGSGARMDEAVGRVENNRLYVSTDPDDIANWAPEFREGRTSSGAPILHGAQTIASRFGDCFGDYYVGQSVEYQFYFLNFAESNNMVYLHAFFRNMSEYLKWHPNPDVVKKVANTPNGQTWVGAVQFYCTANGFRVGGGDEAWADYFPKQIFVQADRNGTESSFTGNPAAMAYYQRRNPSLRDETVHITNTCAQGWNTEYGFYPEEPMEGGYDMGRGYRYAQGRWAATGYFYAPTISPFTGKLLDGWPGVLLPEDARYNQWIWGERNAYNSYNYFGELHNVAPRDSFSLDGVIMFVYLSPPNFGFPSSQDINNIDRPDVQAALAPILRYAGVADIVAEGGYILPETPAPPALTVIPGDRQVTITWSDVNIHTPDAYYGFLQKNPELDPNGVYVEYDFEGYRLYRSFVGPSDSHSELIFQCSKSDANLQFYWKDVYTKDEPLNRMQNGMKVWYALVPYDSNVDPATGKSFSLPDPTSGKLWNRPGGGLYTVYPRSEASNFKDATLGGVAYTPGASAALTEGTSVELRGDGTGKLLDAPKHLEPVVNIRLETVTSEKITAAQSVYMVCSDMSFFDFGGCNWPTGTREMQLKDSNGKVLSKQMITGVHGGDNEMSILLQGKIDAAGAEFGVWGDFSGISPGSLTYGFDTGGYTGADVDAARYRCAMVVESAPNNMGWVRSSQFTITWKSAADGGLTIEVTNNTMNQTVSFGQFPDDLGWGLTPGGTIGDRWGDANNLYNELELPKSERTTKMLQSLPADNTDDFGIWLNGIFWLFTNVSAMPAPGTVMTMYTCWGSWNGDQTVFTQAADLPYPGDTWKIDINPMSLDKKDANLSKIRVVPNPYMASSWLDLSPSSRRIEFVNLPDRCTIRIYSLAGHLVNVLNHIGANRFGWGNYSDWDRLDTNNNPRVMTGYDNHSGAEPWNLRNRFGQTVASGLYFFHVTDSRGETFTGRFYIIN